MLRALGFTRSGRPVWPIAGGSDTPPADPPADPTPSDPPADPPSDPPADPPQDPQPSQLEQDAQAAIQALKDAGQEIPEALSKAVSELSGARREAAQYRTGRNELRTEFDNLKSGLAKALGLDNSDDPPDPEALQAQIAEKDSTLTQTKVELAAYKAAGKHGANPDALLDSRSFLTAAAKLDPTADDFTTKLDDTIKQALEANATLKATPGGGRNGGPAQGPRSAPGTGPKSLEESVNARLNA